MLDTPSLVCVGNLTIDEAVSPTGARADLGHLLGLPKMAIRKGRAVVQMALPYFAVPAIPMENHVCPLPPNSAASTARLAASHPGSTPKTAESGSTAQRVVDGNSALSSALAGTHRPLFGGFMTRWRSLSPQPDTSVYERNMGASCRS